MYRGRDIHIYNIYIYRRRQKRKEKKRVLDKVREGGKRGVVVVGII